MKRYGMFIAIGLLVLVNAAVLAGVVYNRSGEPDATVTLTERELPLASYYGYSDRENTGLSLRLDWSKNSAWFHGFYFGEPRNNRQAEWFNKEKLEAIGFDCKLPLDAPGAEVHYRKMLPIKTYAVLEYEGSAWESWLADEQKALAETEAKAQAGSISPKQLKEAQAGFDREVRTHSRLFVIDAANDAAALRKQYGERGRYLILPATVRLQYYPSTRDKDTGQVPPRIEGIVSEILTDNIYVPKEHRAVLEKSLRDRDSRQAMSSDFNPYGQRSNGPSYEVTLRVGKRAEPWIASVRALVVEAPK